MLSIAQLIREEIQDFVKDYWQDDNKPSLADKVFSKNQGVDLKQNTPINAELIGKADNQYPVYKNPKSLEGFAGNTRGILMANGDLYLSKTFYALHKAILNLLSVHNIVPFAAQYNYDLEYPQEFVAIERVGFSDMFSQSEAYEEFPNYYYEIFDNGSAKQPYTFKYLEDDNLNELESPLDPNYNGVMSNIPPGYVHGILDELNKDKMKNNKVQDVIKSVIKEFAYEGNVAEIEITPTEQDPRSGKKQQKNFDVNYNKTVDGVPLEITGVLSPYNTGRGTEYEFQPDFFTDVEAENYFNENWETVQDEILDKLYDKNR
jgi:hypothetical protein